jgi:hypothetical protein
VPDNVANEQQEGVIFRLVSQRVCQVMTLPLLISAFDMYEVFFEPLQKLREIALQIE